MEVNILCPTAAAPLPPVQWNYEDVKKYAMAVAANYSGRVYTDRDLPVAKADRAQLNHLKAALDQRRKDLKAMYLEPYTTFEAQIKEVIGIIDESANGIAQQLDAYEQARKDEKMQFCKDVFAAWAKELDGQVDFDLIYNPRWLNKTFSPDEIENDIKTSLAKVRAGISAIKGACPAEDLDAIMADYFKHLDLGKSIQMIDAAKAQRERRMQAEQARPAAVPHPTQQVNTAVFLPEPEISEPAHAAPPMDRPAAQPVECRDFRVWATREQLGLLREFLIGNNIKYGRVPAAQ